MPAPDTGPLKMISHNHLLTADEGGETAFIKAREMGISLVRHDFRYREMATPDGWQWDTGESNRWNDLLDPSLRWTKKHGMRTIVNLIAYSVPQHLLAGMNARWREQWAAFPQSRRGPKELDDRDCVLWAARSDAEAIDAPSAYVEALLDRLAQGQAAGEYDVAGFCILNEPNTKWPGEPNWRSLEIPYAPRVAFGYDTAKYCSDMCDWVKAHIQAKHQDTLGHTINVVNLYSYRGHWTDDEWMLVASNPNLDILGIDIYWDQLWGLFARGRAEAMRSLAAKFGKDWWLVETAGADNPGWLTRNPSCRDIKARSDLCAGKGAAVLGYYRLWGDRGGRMEYGRAYNVFTDPGPEPTPRTDGRECRYWEAIRDL